MKKTLGQKIKYFRELAGMSQAKLAKACGWVSQSRIGNYETDKREPSLADLDLIAKALSITRSVLLNDVDFIPPKSDKATVVGHISAWDDSTPLEDDEVELPLIKEIELSAGNGSIPIHEYKTKAKLRFGKSTLSKQGVNYQKSICVVVSGNSMEPFIPDGATVGIDTSNTDIVDGKIYAIAIDGDLVRLKILYKLSGSKVRLRSFNRDEYEDEDYSLEEIRVIGKMFWSSVLWN